MTPAGQYIPSFLVDYKKAVESIKRVREIPAKELVLSHYGPVDEKDRGALWDLLLKHIEESRDKRLEIIRSYDTEEERLAVMEKIFHTGIDKKDQPEDVYKRQVSHTPSSAALPAAARTRAARSPTGALKTGASFPGLKMRLQARASRPESPAPGRPAASHSLSLIHI